MATVTETLSAHPSSYDSTHYSWASTNTSYPISNGYTDSSSTTYARINLKTGSQAESYIYYTFDFSTIPDGATITAVTASGKANVSTTNTTRVATKNMQLATGFSSNITMKGSATSMPNTAASTTISSVGSWTVSEIKDAGIRFYAKRGTGSTSSTYYFRIYGATMSVTYQYNDVTYTITVSNSSSATVTANPDEVHAGESSTIISDRISGLTVTDNNVDVTSQFQEVQETGGSYTITNRGSYGFALSNNYYVSQNKGIDKSAAVARVNFSVPVAATITFTFINYAEQGYDFGVFGNIDTELSTNYYAAGSSGATITDSSYKLACNTSTYNNSSTHTVTYSMSAGDHYIDVKFSKDDGSASYNDTLQFQVSITLDEPFTPGVHYEYTITNIQTNHTIVVTQSGSQPTIYFKSNGSWVAATQVYKKVNGSWVLQTTLTNVFDSSTNYLKG